MRRAGLRGVVVGREPGAMRSAVVSCMETPFLRSPMALDEQEATEF
jgi:hypothetical protein